jgi:predicted O-methyltransferase YrrM
MAKNIKKNFQKVINRVTTEVVELVSVTTAYPPGHFYSPIVDPIAARAKENILWPTMPHKILGIDFNDASHEAILTRDFPQFMPAYDYPSEASAVTTKNGFYTNNSQFSWLDSRALFVLLQKWRPKRIIEVGSGFSSLLMADVNRRFLDRKCEINCIEPYPRPFLTAGVDGIHALIEKQIQDIPLDFFDQLNAGDILFIDSTHVAKTGSDVNYLFFEILPRLKRGVYIHIHDIFLPNEYPKEWVITVNRSWNEQYLLRALLMYSTAFKVIFGCSYAFTTIPALVQAALNHLERHTYAGGSIWLERI